MIPLCRLPSVSAAGGSPDLRRSSSGAAELPAGGRSGAASARRVLTALSVVAGTILAGGAAPLVAQQLTPEELAELSRPGPEHERLQALEGGWEVHADGRVVGYAEGRLRLGDRFLELEIHSQAGPVLHAIYTFGFDRRHGEYTVSAMDETGTYAVHARGWAEGDRVVMRGTDDDPVMTAMGLEKAFAIVLRTPESGDAVVETRLVDTRTEERREMPFFSFVLRRPS